MLALTDNANRAIEGILSAPSIPDGAGVRIAAAASDTGEAPPLQAAVADVPAETDRVIAERGARVFVDAAVVDYLDDKLLDADIGDDGVSFAIGQQP
jgi:Fe-S cluster assembly iron-binding protein IscA